MKLLIIKLRIKIADFLVRLAHWIRPKIVSELMKLIQDSLIYGNGVTRIDPKEFYKPTTQSIKELDGK